jgi:hypothetical protein
MNGLRRFGSPSDGATDDANKDDDEGDFDRVESTISSAYHGHFSIRIALDILANRGDRFAVNF